MKRLRPIIALLGGLFAAVFLFFAWKNSLVVTGVSILVKPGVAEHLDHSVMGFGAEHRLPDYKVTLRVNRKFLPIDLGTKLNTSATNWIDFSVAEIIPLQNLQEVVIIEDDKVENDVLDRIQPQGESFAGSSFQVKLTTERSFDAGLSWFFNTPIGKAISTGIIIAIILIISSFF